MWDAEVYDEHIVQPIVKERDALKARVEELEANQGRDVDELLIELKNIAEALGLPRDTDCDLHLCALLQRQECLNAEGRVKDLEHEMAAIFAHLGAADMGADAFVKHCHSYAEMRALVEELEAQAPRWRPVIEGPPEAGPYQVVTADGEEDWAHWNGEKWAADVAYWMPLPALPADATPEDAGEVADGE